MIKIRLFLKNLIKNISSNSNETIKGKLIFGIFWNFLSAIASQGFPLIAAIITARLLGTFNYGQLGIINSTIILFSTFAGLGLGITATRYVAQYHKSEKNKTGRIIGLINIFGILSGLLMFVILFAIAPWLASNVLNASDLTTLLRIASLLLILNTITGIQSGSIAGFGAFKDLARIALFQGIISGSLTITGVYFFGITGAVIALVINSIINLMLYKITINSLTKSFKIKIEYLKSWQEKEIIWKLSFPSMLSSVMIGPVAWIGNIFIINTPGGYGQLGIFMAADQWRTALSFLPMVIGGVLLPLISANISNKNKSLEIINVLSSWVIVILIALPLITFPEIIGFIYGQGYSSASFLESLAIMMFVSCIISYKEGIARKLVVNDLMWWGVLSNITWAFIFVCLILIFKEMGSLGLAISYLLSYGINTIIFIPLYISKKVIPKKMIISKEVLVIWLILILQTSITLLNISLWVRLITLIISLIILFYSLYQIWNVNFNNSAS